MKNKLIYFIAGLLVSFFAVFLYFKNKEKTINEDYYVISNQISKLNKMVVLEQDFSSFQTHKSQAFQAGGYDFLPKEMVLYSTAKAQVTYDLKKMNMEVDSVQKKIIITQIPSAEIKIFPEVKIHFMDDYAINRFDKNEINQIVESAKENMRKSVDQNKLRNEGRKQLLQNLNEIFVLAKAFNYTIEDKTNSLDLQNF